MQTAITDSAVIRYLKEQYESKGIIDRLIKYRTLICPFISLIEMVKPGEKVGDVGFGSGQFLLLASHFAKPSRIFGIEVSPKMTEVAQTRFNHLPAGTYDFSTYDGLNFPEQLKEMDVIFLIDVLHHVPKKNQEIFIKNLVSVLRPGARLVLKDINASSPLVYLNKLHDLVFAHEIGNEMSMDSARKLLQENGLEIIQEAKRTMYVYPHYTLVAKKA